MFTMKYNFKEFLIFRDGNVYFAQFEAICETRSAYLFRAFDAGWEKHVCPGKTAGPQAEV